MTPMSAKEVGGRRAATEHEVELPYRSLVERVPAIVYVDPAGPEPTSPSYVSPYIETMLGYTPEVATGDAGWWAQGARIPTTANASSRSGRRSDDVGRAVRR